jgi:hypothetical protein
MIQHASTFSCEFTNPHETMLFNMKNAAFQHAFKEKQVEGRANFEQTFNLLLAIDL